MPSYASSLGLNAWSSRTKLRWFGLHRASGFGGHKTVDVPVITLNGVSKVFFAPGWRIGWFGIHDPTRTLGAVRDALERLLRSRLCASTPAQQGYLAGLTGDRSWMGSYLERVKAQRQRCLERIAAIDGLEVEAPGGAFYMFVRLTDNRWASNDKQFVLDLLHEEHVLLVHARFQSNTGTWSRAAGVLG